MGVEHIGVVSGLTDVANFLAASARHNNGAPPERIVMALFGREVSLPPALQSDFAEIAARAFPQAEIAIVPTSRVELKEFVSEGYDAPVLARRETRRVVFSAALQSRFTRSFLAWLAPDALVFFDNGLSSYSDWPANTLEHLESAGAPRPETAYLSLHPGLEVPAYLSALSIQMLGEADFAHPFKRLRAGAAARPPGEWLPAHVIVGTSLFRTGRISWEAERAVYLRLIEKLKADGATDILFKAHPRAVTQPLITAEDGVEVFDSPVPLEAYVRPRSTGTVYSISSSALITMPQFYGWQARRLVDLETRKLFDAQRAIQGLEREGVDARIEDIWLGEPSAPAPQPASPAAPVPQRFGVTVFGYSHFQNFRELHERQGVYDVNIGDNMQTMAGLHALQALGIARTQIDLVDRDTLPTYDGPPIAVVMNGVFAPHSFPPSDKVRPIFVGFNAKRPLIRQFADYFRAHQPIGCRDTATKEIFDDFGIQAFVSGCLTLSLPQRSQAPAEPKLFVIYGSGVGALPGEVLQYVPPEWLETAEFVYQRMPVGRFPLDAEDRAIADRQAARLLEEYRTRATLVLTPLHHAATPCLASGIPVIIARTVEDTRFSFLSQLLPIYLPGQFANIDWSPQVPDLRPIREAHRAALLQAIEALGVSLPPAPQGLTG